MPHVERYEPYLLAPLRAAGVAFEPVWLRLLSHRYSSSSAAHLEQHYRSVPEVLREGPLAGLIITGAPVEELAFSEVHYWPELDALLRETRVPVLGLCWGGLALAWQLGIEKCAFEHKLFGLYDLTDGTTGGVFQCPQSRHAGIADDVLERAAAEGRVRLLAHGPEAGYSIFESHDGQRLMHLGHPEYDAERLVFEYRRDLALGRSDVSAPAQLDVAHPFTSWLAHRDSFFARWLRRCADQPASSSRPAS